MDAFFDRMSLWLDLQTQGFKTTPEAPEPTRSDCHGWGSHPIYHFFATVMGVRPDSFGFSAVDIRPQPGPLKHINGKIVHPSGWIEADFAFENNHLSGSIILPHDVHGTLRYNNRTVPLRGGAKQIIEC